MMKVSIAAFTLLISPSVAVAASSISNKSGLRNSNKESMRRDLQFTNDVGDFFNIVTNNNDGDGIRDWELILSNKLFGGGDGGGGTTSFWDMMGGIEAIKDSIDWEFVRETLAGSLEEALANENFRGLPEGLNWEAIGGNGNEVDWNSLLEDVDLSNLMENVDWESALENFDPSTLMESFDFDQVQNYFNGNFGDGFNFENLPSIDWTNGNAWQEVLTDVMEGIDLSDIDIDWTDVNACEVVQLVNGIAPSFSVNANCRCDGNLAEGLDIGCEFSGCAFDDDDEGCGEVNLDMSLARGEDAGRGVVNMKVCTKFDNDDNEEEQFEDLCITYGMDRSDGGRPVQTCGASYGDDLCECAIDENFCVTLDCSAIREDAVMDRCTPLGMMRNKNDFDNFVPPLQMLAASAEVVKEEENVDNIISNKPNNKNTNNKKKKKNNNKKRKFAIGSNRKKRTCVYVKKRINKTGSTDICDEQINNNPAKTVRDRCRNIC